MNICITGALGHIGSQLIRNLSAPFLNKVYLVDNFLTQRYASLFDLPSGVNYYFHEMDILSKDIVSIIEDSDILIHLAAVTNAEASFQDSELVDKINKKGLENIARLCTKHNCSLIFPSTTSVYGSQSNVVDESCKDSDLHPQSPYAESKLYGEKLLQSLSQKNKLNFVIFRLGTIFGYSIGMRFHTAVNKFIWQAATGQEITVWKTALDQKRPYCGLNDCINAINHTISKQIFDCQIYNIVSMNLAVKNIIDAIKEHIPDVRIKFVDSPIMNQLSYNASNKKSLERGIAYGDNLKDSIRESIDKLRNVNYSIVKQNL
ncbi:MAG: SDR family oxidoreductase [Candidatus Omnitrophica bacterium]|nr:SDR family oxidoreductase [Candidatus Omnitrophota bacterium]